MRSRGSRERLICVTAGRQALGARGEQLAARWYESNGYAVLDRNWRCRTGELDIVARSGSTIVFIEVKTRYSDAYGSPAAAVTVAKQRRIRALAIEWLRANAVHGTDVRFDVACVIGNRVEVLEAAF